jgi:glutamate-1-semialdehyde aminotransferase
VKPDLVVYGKAVANGFPWRRWAARPNMDSIIDPDPARRPFVAGHLMAIPWRWPPRSRPVRYLIANGTHLSPDGGDGGGDGSRDHGHFARRGITACVARQGSALFLLFDGKAACGLCDIIRSHDFARDVALRRALIQRGVFFVPIATKQCSLSAPMVKRYPSPWSSLKAPLPRSGKAL